MGAAPLVRTCLLDASLRGRPRGVA